MSPRPAQPDLRNALLEAAATVLAEEGPTGLSTRRLAREVGTSAMAVYTYFGSMEDLVRAVVHEGFARLNVSMRAIGDSDDPIADVVAHGRVYRWNAFKHPHLYRVMLGLLNVAGFSLTNEDRRHGRYVLDILVASVQRCMATGRLRHADAELVAHQFWTALHGIVTLELGGYLFEPYDAEACFNAQVHSLLVGNGDQPVAARTSMHRSIAIAGSALRTAGEWEPASGVESLTGPKGPRPLTPHS
ncbi:TetR/AcrR family transcriptional regulator [Streptomyces sp. NPDC019224]|uniref:TetR/AcrR family transcriptional regulator n=1 Tax=Streptomyces sp. NPDC019224 TaxID=3154484 RepID=UPI0033E90CEB